MRKNFKEAKSLTVTLERVRRFQWRTIVAENYLGKTVPDFTLKASDGQTIALKNLKGRKILLYFFTSPGGGN